MINKVKKLETYEQVKEKALTLLEFRSHSKSELSQKLKIAGAEEESIERVMLFLEEYNLINDEEYAKRYAADLKNLKKLGKNRIKSELFRKGISSETVENVMSDFEEDDEELLYELVCKKLKNNFEKKNKDKAIRYFLYRGYGFEEIKSCMECAENEYMCRE